MTFLKIGFLLPKGWIGAWYLGAALSALLADINFSNTVTTGSVIVAGLVVVLSGLFTFRNNLRSFWHDLAVERGEEINEMKATIADRDAALTKMHEAMNLALQKQAEEQRVIRHDLKNERAALRLQLQAEQQKTDLTSLAEQLGKQHSEAMAMIVSGLHKQEEIIQLLASRGGTMSATHGRDE